MTTQDKLSRLLNNTFTTTCEAEAIIYAGGCSRELKDHIIRAHSALLAAKNLYDSERRRYEAPTL